MAAFMAHTIYSTTPRPAAPGEARPGPETQAARGLCGRVAAVEKKRLAGHEIGARRREIDRQRTDLLGPPDPPRRNVTRQPLIDRRIRKSLVGHVGREPAQRARERDDATLRRSIDRVTWQAHLTEDRGDVDHLAGLLGDQVGRRRATSVEHAG